MFSSQEYCLTCRAYHRPGQHLPTWRVMLAECEEDAFDDWRSIHARSAESAAERYVELQDAYDCDYASLDEPQRVVVMTQTGRRYYEVSGEQTIVYTTREVT